MLVDHPALCRHYFLLWQPAAFTEGRAGVTELVATELRKAEQLWRRAMNAGDRSDEHTG